MTWKQDRARLAGLGNAKDPDPVKIGNARRDLSAAKLEEFVRRTVEKAPPLTPEQRDRIAVALWSTAAEETDDGTAA